jgi:hypothetical protein
MVKGDISHKTITDCWDKIGWIAAAYRDYREERREAVPVGAEIDPERVAEMKVAPVDRH